MINFLSWTTFVFLGRTVSAFFAIPCTSFSYSNAPHMEPARPGLGPAFCCHVACPPCQGAPLSSVPASHDPYSGASLILLRLGYPPLINNVAGWRILEIISFRTLTAFLLCLRTPQVLTEKASASGGSTALPSGLTPFSLPFSLEF